MKHHIFGILSLTLLLAGCNSTSSPRQKSSTESRQTLQAKPEFQIEMEQETKKLVTGTKELLEGRLSNSPCPDPETDIALDFVTQAERLLGGEPAEKIEVDDWIKRYRSSSKDYDKKLADKDQEITELKKLQENNNRVVASLKQSFVRKQKAKLIIRQVAFVLAVIVCSFLLYFIFGFISRRSYKPAKYFGIGGADIIEDFVRGIQEARLGLARLPDNTALTKWKALEIIDNKLIREAGSATKNAVDDIKYTESLLSASKIIGAPQNSEQAGAVLPETILKVANNSYVDKAVLEDVIKGVQAARTKLASKPEEESISPAAALSVIDSNLQVETDAKSKTVIKQVKKDLDLGSVTEKKDPSESGN